MDDMNQQNPGIQPEQPQTHPAWTPPPMRVFPAGAKDKIFAIVAAICAIGFSNCLLFGGLNIGAAIFAAVYMVGAGVYLASGGQGKKSVYGMVLVGLTAAIALSFLRNDDGGLKFLLLLLICALFPLGITVLAGQNRWDSGETGSLLDGFHTLFVRGFGDSITSIISLFKSRNNTKDGRKTFRNVLLGLAIALPLLLVLLVLLRSADAAFEMILKMLPEINIPRIMVTMFLAGGLVLPLLGMGMSLRHEPKTDRAKTQMKGFASTIINTILVSVCVIYVIYLISQLAYFFGGFSGLLPAGYTASQYARRGFFEMGVISMLNLGLIIIAVWTVEKKDGLPKLTRALCLFIALVTLVLIGSAYSKMYLYISRFGLTYMRVLTCLFMLWLALAVVLVGLNLFKKVPYMKVLVVSALLMALVVSWAGLDTLVAKYNVNQYLSGSLQAVDVDYLEDLDSAGVPYMAQLLDCNDPEVREQAREALHYMAWWDYDCESVNGRLQWTAEPQDLRAWNITEARARSILCELVITGRLDK